MEEFVFIIYNGAVRLKNELRIVCFLIRLDCLRRILKGKVDFSVFNAEDLVTAANSDIPILLTNELKFTDG